MANPGEPMDIDDISEFDDKENSLQHTNVSSHQTDKGYEELDVSELNMKLRWSTSTQFSPASSPMSKSSTATCLDNSLDSDALNNTIVNENSNLSHSLNSSTAKSDTLVKTPKLLPLQVLPSGDTNRSASAHRQFDGTITLVKNDITVTITEACDNDDNFSLASSSTSPDCTPEATTPVKEIPKPTGSPIMRGIKSVLNMFRPSQSPIPPEENEVKSTISEILRPIKGISPLTNENALDSRPQSVIASTPISNHRKDKECSLSKRNSPLKESIVFNEDLEKELEWKEDSTIIFTNKERTPFHKLFFHQTLTSPENSTLTEGNVEQKCHSFVEPMDVSYNNSTLKDKTTQIGYAINDSTLNFSENELQKDEIEFLDCETTINESQLFKLLNDIKEKAPGMHVLEDENISSAVNNVQAQDITPTEKNQEKENISSEVNNVQAQDITPHEKNQEKDEIKHEDLAMKTADIRIACEDIAVLSNHSEEILEKSVSSNVASLYSSQVFDNLPSLLENVEGTKPNTTSVTASDVAANIDCNTINTVALNTNYNINPSKCLPVITKIDQPMLDQSLEMASNTSLLLNRTADIIECAKIPLPEDKFTDIETDFLHDPKLDVTVECKINDVPAKKSLDDSKLIETVPASDIESANSNAIETTHMSLAETITLPVDIQVSEKNMILNKSTISLPENDLNHSNILVNTSEDLTKEFNENKGVVHIIEKISTISDTKQELIESVQDYSNDTITAKEKHVSLLTTPDIRHKLDETTISQDSKVTFIELNTSKQNIHPTESESVNRVSQHEESSLNISESIEPEHLQTLNSSLDANSMPHVDIVTQPMPSNCNTPVIVGNATEVISKELEDKKDVKLISEIFKVTEISEIKQEALELVQGNPTINKITHVSLPGTPSNISEPIEPEHLETIYSSLDANFIPHVDIVTQLTPSNCNTPITVGNASEVISKELEDKEDVKLKVTEISEVKQEALETIQGNPTINKIIHVSLPGSPDHKLEETAVPKDNHTTLIGLLSTKDNLQFIAESQIADQIDQLDESKPEIVTGVFAPQPIEGGNKSFDVGLGPCTDIGFQHSTTTTTTNFSTTEIICNAPKDSAEEKAVLNVPEISIASEVNERPIASAEDYTNNTTINAEEYVGNLKFEETAIFNDGTVAFTDLQPMKNKTQITSDSQTADNTCQLIKSPDMTIKDSVELEPEQDVNKYLDLKPHGVVTQPINFLVKESIDISMTELHERDVVQVNAARTNNTNVCESLEDILSTKNNDRDIQIVKEGSEIQATNKLATNLHLIENVHGHAMDISACQVKEQGIRVTENNKYQIVENIDTATVIEKTESNEQESLTVTSTDILIQKTEEDKEIEALEEELIFSENNSPYVSLSAPEELSEQDKAEDVLSTQTNIAMSASPPISSKGYNINFDEIENPFVSKSEIRVSPNLNQTFVPIDKVPANSSFTIEQSPIKPEPNKTITLDCSSALINGLPKETHLDITQCIKEDQGSLNLSKPADLEEIKINYLQSEKQLPGDLTPNTVKAVDADIIVNKTYEEIKDEIPGTNQIDILDVESNVNITSKTIEVENVVFDKFATSSSEQSTYYSIGTFSGEETESKPTSSLSDVDEMNVNPFASKSKVRKTPPPDSEDLFANKSNIPFLPPPEFETENPFKTKNKIRQSPPPNSENHNPIETKTKISDSPNTSSIFAKRDALVADNPQCQRSSENKSTAESLYPESEEPNINNTTCSESSEASNEKESTVKEVHTEDEETMEGPFIEADLEHDDGKLSAIESEKVEINQFTDLPPQETDENFEAAGEMFIDADAFEFLMNQNKTGEVTDSGKESLFLKFDPLFARRVNSDGIVDVLSKLQKRQSTPKKMRSPLPQDLMSLEKSPIAGPSNVASVQNTTSESSCEDLNITVAQKPTMVVPPAVNPVVTPRKKATTPVRSCNRLSMNFTSPAMAVIDRLLSLSANNSPASPERAPPINMEQREADRALMQLRELLAEKELNVHHLRCESKELKDRFTVLDTQMKNLEAEGEKRLKNIKELSEKLAEKNQENKSMSAVVEEYERTIAGLIAGIEEDKKKHAEERLQLITERDEQTAHLASMEVAFSDLHSKYEKSKQVIMSYKAREDTYKKSNQEFKDNVDKMQNNYELLKQHATSKLNHANQELEKMNRSHETEVLKLNAMIKRKDLHISSLEETLAQKTKANEELTAICDDLINRVG